MVAQWLKLLTAAPGCSFLLLCLLGGLPQANAQKFHFDQYTEADGLPQAYLYALAQDSLGYLWGGTGEGLIRYDGSYFELYNTSDGLAENFVSALHYTTGGRMWIGHYQGGITVLEGGNFKQLRKGESGSMVTAITTAPDGKVWIGTQRDSLFVYDGTKLVAAHDLKALGGLQLLTHTHNANGQLMLGTDEGLLVAEPNSGGINVVQQPEGLAYISVGALSAIDDGIFLAGTPDDGIYEVLPTDNGYTVGRQFTEANCDLSRGNIRVITKTPDGRHLAGSTTGFSNFSYTRDKGIHTVRNINSRNLLINPNISAIVLDRDENYWIGTRGGGLLRFPGNSFVLMDEDAGLIHEEILSLTSGPGRYFWVGTRGGYARVYRARNTDTTEVQNFEFFPATAVHHDGNTLWIGTEKHGLFRVTDDAGAPEPVDLSMSFEGYPIQDLKTDAQGRLWIATLLGGAFRYDPATGNREDFNSTNGLLHNDIYQITIDSKEQVWFTTLGIGIALLNGSRFRYLGREQGLSYPDINAIYEAPDGYIWVATAGAGIFRFDGNQFEQWTRETGLISDFIYALFSDQSGDLWAVAGSSLTRFNPETNSFSPYSGLSRRFNLSFTTREVLEKPNGTFAIGTDRGFALFTPTVQRPEPVVKTSITGMAALGRAVDMSQDVEIPYEQRKRVQFSFNSISLAQQEGIVFEYRLLGADTSWTSTRLTQVDYANLNNGKYRFEVRAYVQGAPRLGPSSGYDFVVLTPFWKTWWFLVLVASAFTVALVSFIQLRERTLRADKLKLARAVKSRTRELEAQKGRLEQFAYAISHDLKNPVLNIAGLLEVVKEGSEALDEDAGEALELLEVNAGQLQSNLFDMMEIIKAQNSAGQDRQDVELKPLLEDIETSILLMIQKANARIETDFDTCPTVFFNRTDLRSIIYNLVTNGIKYCKPNVPPVLTIKSWRVDDYDVISVRDNGLGMNLEKDGTKLFAMFKRIHSHVEGSGVGLHLIKTIVEGNGGHIEVDSTPGEGTGFRVFLPRKEADD